MHHYLHSVRRHISRKHTQQLQKIHIICRPAGQRDITVKLMNAQRQRGNSDCGVFACAHMERLKIHKMIVKTAGRLQISIHPQHGVLSKRLNIA